MPRFTHTYTNDEVGQLLDDALEIMAGANVTDPEHFAVVFPHVFGLLAQKAMTQDVPLLGMPRAALDG